MAVGFFFIKLRKKSLLVGPSPPPLTLMARQLKKINFVRLLYSGQSTKAFSPPPLGSLVKRTATNKVPCFLSGQPLNPPP